MTKEKQRSVRPRKAKGGSGGVEVLDFLYSYFQNNKLGIVTTPNILKRIRQCL
jgi:hypothetical protein